MFTTNEDKAFIRHLIERLGIGRISIPLGIPLADLLADQDARMTGLG